MENLANFSIDVSTDYSAQCTFTNEILIRYIGTSIFFIGIISTLLSICVFTRKPLRKSHRIFAKPGHTPTFHSGRKSCCFYFLILAISDAIHLTTMTIEHLPYGFHVDLIIIHSLICKLTIFMIYFSNHLSNIVLTLASM